MTPKQIIETILFACENSISKNDIRKILNQNIDDNQINVIINELNDEYRVNKKGIYIDSINNGYQIRTHPEYHKYIESIKNKNNQYKLTKAALEVLSIIAFKQPISKLDIESIRGVDSVGVIKTLLDKDLILIKGREDKMGRALLYGTAPLFLDTFGLNNISDLPKISEIKEILSDEIK